MTPLFLIAIAALSLVMVYIAALSARGSHAGSSRAGSFGTDGGALPGWAVMFASAGIMIAGMDLPGHFALVGSYGLQASHLALGLILAAMAGLLFRKKLWLAARLAGLTSPGEALGRYYGSVALRVFMLGVTLIFALPFAAQLLSGTGGVIEAATGGALPRAAVIWALAFALFLPAVIGGWRAVVLGLGIQSLLLAVLIAFTAGFSQLVLPALSLPTIGQDGAGLHWDQIPGVMRYSAGLGKDVLAGGIFTTTAIASAALALVGLAISPGVLWLAQTARPGRETGFGMVWLVAGLGGGLLVLGAPLFALRLDQGLGGYVDGLAVIEPLAALGLVLMLVLAGQMAAGFFLTSGVFLVSHELILRFILPARPAAEARLIIRIGLGFGFFALAVLATFAPLVSAVFASLALPMALQALPALLGLCFVPWISRGAVLAGLVFGVLLVFFTEPPGLILFEALFLDLPWGRWPLTLHSAVWGLGFNLGVVLLASIFSARGPERLHRERLHRAFAASQAPRPSAGRRATALWSLTLIWAFMALGPGAILGNWFFSQPIFTSPDSQTDSLTANLTGGLPSLLIWQLLFWLIGVMLVWWLAERAALGDTSAARIAPIVFEDPSGAPAGSAAPAWIASGLSRVTRRL